MENRHYYTDNADLPSHRKEYNVFFRGKDFTFITDEGVFSKNGLDYGSRVLLEALAQEHLKGKILDMGCGYGPISVILASMFPECQVDGADINSRAVELCRLNAESNNVHIHAFVSELYQKVRNQYDFIVTNPPIRAGKKTVFADYEGGYSHLIKGGALYVVIQKKQGADSSVRKLMELFGNCVTISRSSGYHVLKSVKTN